MASLAALSIGCNTASGHRVLSFFFDGVPEPGSAPAARRTGDLRVTSPAVRPADFTQHQPYAEKNCAACHDAQAMNRLVAPGEQLCFQCHDLGKAKRYVHGPIAGGGCLVCHDPHRSQYRHLLVSDSVGFCLRCHDRAALRPVEGHAAEAGQCTDCHDAHMSDQRYLLR